MALTEEEMEDILKDADAVITKATEVVDDVKALKRKLKKEEKDKEE